MTRVKICGITNLRDARAAVEAGADALGFNFWPGSRRCITPGRARAILRQLPPLVTSVGLFVNEKPVRIRKIARKLGLSVVQLHGDESGREVRELARAGLQVIKAVPVGKEFRAAQLKRWSAASAFLLDTEVRGERGGTGRSFDWKKARAAKKFGRVILAGGLNPSNVSRAIREARPFAVDVSSGVERRPGKKDAAQVREFIRKAKSVR